MQGRPKAIIDGFGCMPPSLLSAAAVGGDQRRRAKAKSRNRSLIARGTGSSNPPPLAESRANFQDRPNSSGWPDFQVGRVGEGDDHPARLFLRFATDRGEKRAMEVIWGNRLKPGDYKYIGGFPHFVADAG